MGAAGESQCLGPGQGGPAYLEIWEAILSASFLPATPSRNLMDNEGDMLGCG